MLWHSQKGTNAELSAAMFVYYDYKECVADRDSRPLTKFRALLVPLGSGEL